MADQAEHWSRAAKRYEQEFIDPYLPEVRNPLLQALERLPRKEQQTVADLGCGVGPLLPVLAGQFAQVLALDFAQGMLDRARERCPDRTNIEYLRCNFTELASLGRQVDVAVAVNSLVLPDLSELHKSLQGIHDLIRPGGHFLGIVPAMDSVHYLTMLMVDRALGAGMPMPAACKNAAHHVEHELYDFAFGEFRYRGLVQHFWQPFEITYRLRQIGFRRVKLAKVALAWRQFGCARDLQQFPPPWDWFFQAEKKP